MQQTHILIIGGGPAGMVVANASRLYYPEKTVTILKKNERAMVPCGIPYIFGNKLASPEDDMIPCGATAPQKNLQTVIDEALDIDFATRVVTTKTGERWQYEKLVFATGSIPKKPHHIPNVEAEGVYYVPKESDYITRLHQKLTEAQKIAVIGTGFIGVEIAGELADKGKNVTLIGSRILKHAFDPEFSDTMEAIMINQPRIQFMKNKRIRAVNAEHGSVDGIILDDGEKIACDAVIMAVGYVPNTGLAKKAGLSMREFDTIYVDEYMRTTQPDVFAVGDCAEKRHFITRRGINIMLASTATTEARIAAGALYGIRYAKSFSGTIDIFSTVINDTCFASAGLTEEDAKKQQFDIVCGTFESAGKHPAKLPGNHQQIVKIVAMKATGVVIGGQVIGGIDAGEMINVIGLAIEMQMSIFDLMHLQVATHPLLTAAPTNYPIHKAAEQAMLAR